MKNLAKILKDCPKGTKLYSPLFGEVEFYSVENNEETNICYIVVLDPQDPFYSKEEFRDLSRVSFSSDGRWFDGRGECMLFPSKDNRDWDTFNAPQIFKKGDVVARVYEDESFLLLMGDTDWSSPNNRVNVICFLNLYNNIFYVSKPTDFWRNVSAFCAQGGYRLATDEEKAKLLDVIDKNGYVWDDEKLELRKKEENPKFKKGDFFVSKTGIVGI